MFTQEEKKQFADKGIDIKVVEQQIKNFEKGFPFAKISDAATIENGGILKLSENKITESIKKHDSYSKSIIKFVPASGAATRMFKDLLAFFNGSESEIKNKDILEFFERIEEFAFYEELNNKVKAKFDFDLKTLISNKNYKKILEVFLFEEGLNYSKLPKGLLKFHKYSKENRTSVVEHLVEAANYANSEGVAKVHFTVSQEHISLFKNVIENKKEGYEKEFKLKFNYDFSIQKPATDTIAVGMDNQPFRNDDGSIFFRPGGHGALIENLNDIDSDIIFVKNIDNIVPDRLKSITYNYKKALAGLLIEYQSQIFDYLQKLDNDEINENNISEILQFIEKRLNVKTNNIEKLSFEKQKTFIRNKLDRPIRACGMVENQAEPGGGPFFVENEDKSVSLQIVEKSQIDLSDKKTNTIFEAATHFNPVDLICGVKNYKGEKFNLLNFIDHNAGFISEKSKDGKDLKAQELPGLWNGAMADWNTIFVETPLITFNPVKTINDLLRSEHL